MTNEPEQATPRRYAGFQFGLFHLFAVMTITAIMLSVLRVVQLPLEFLVIFGGYLAVYTAVRGPFVAVKLSRLWQRRQQLLIERQRLERQMVETLRARGKAAAADQSSDDGRSSNKLTL
jgi:hypothetical protein